MILLHLNHQSSIIRVPNGEPLAKPAWFFPEWKFIDVPQNKNIPTVNVLKTPPKSNNTSNNVTNNIQTIQGTPSSVNNASNKNTISNTDSIKNNQQQSFSKPNYEKLITGKWRLAHLTGFTNDGVELVSPKLGENCFLIFDAIKHESFNAGDCANNYIDKWEIVGKTLIINEGDKNLEYEILQLDNSILKTKLIRNHDYGYILHTYERVNRL